MHTAVYLHFEYCIAQLIINMEQDCPNPVSSHVRSQEGWYKYGKYRYLLSPDPLSYTSALWRRGKRDAVKQVEIEVANPSGRDFNALRNLDK